MFPLTTSRLATEVVDVELPLHGQPPVDIDLADADTPIQASPALEANFRPTLSQVAGQALQSRVRWPGRSRAGYHGGTSWNWMRDGSAGFGERTMGR
jgi:hypothetical protein